MLIPALRRAVPAALAALVAVAATLLVVPAAPAAAGDCVTPTGGVTICPGSGTVVNSGKKKVPGRGSRPGDPPSGHKSPGGGRTGQPPGGSPPGPGANPSGGCNGTMWQGICLAGICGGLSPASALPCPPLGGVGGACAGPTCAQQNAPAVAPPAVPARVIAESAAKTLAYPGRTIGTSPRADSYVRLDTYLWITGGWGAVATDPATITARTVVVTATPVRVDWNTGESSLTCAGPGSPDTADCSYTYQRSSAGQAGAGNDRAYRMTASVRYRLAWTCTGACDEAGGDLPGTTIPVGAARLRVLERQAEVTAAN